MAKVFLKRVSGKEPEKVSEAAKEMLSRLDPGFSGEVPLKVHFGEDGCTTYIKQENFSGIIEYLNEKGCSPFYTDTNVLYKGRRTTRKEHAKLAAEHGFDAVPVRIADGEKGEENEKVQISGKHYEKCSIGKVIADSEQIVVLSHFKGHALAGFGGAIKQLSMGGASREGKLAMHSQARPVINPVACKKCMTCAENCPVEACIISKIPHIDKNKCIGCAACIAVCPHNAVKVNWVSTGKKEFLEKLAEYALAAQKGKEAVYISFAFDITKNCDCDGTPQKPFASDIGVLASADPVSLDRACLDLVRESEGEKVFGGDHAFEHSEKIGLGSSEYELEEI